MIGGNGDFVGHLGDMIKNSRDFVLHVCVGEREKEGHKNEKTLKKVL